MRRLLLFTLLVLCHELAVAQQFQLRNYNTEQGLPHATVYRSFQDHEGYMWFCTDAGVCSFDGRTFTTSTFVEDSLLFSSVISMSEDNKGNKLITTYHDGIMMLSDSAASRYQISNGKYPLFKLYASALGDNIWLIARDSAQFLYQVHDHSIRWHNVVAANGSNVRFNKMLKYNNTLLCATDNGIYVVSDTSVYPLLPTLIHDEVVDVKPGRNGHLFIALKHKIIETDGKGIVGEHTIDNKKVIGNILVDRQNNVWISQYGTAMFMLKNGVVSDITHSLPMPNMYINDLFEDNEGNIWLATYNNGVYMIPAEDIVSYPFGGTNNTYCTDLQPYGNSSVIVSSIGKVGIYTSSNITPLNIHSLDKDEFVYFARAFGEAIYIGTPYKLIRRSMRAPYTEKVIRLPRNSGAVSIYMDSSKKIWLGGFLELFLTDGTFLTPAHVSTGLKRYNSIIEDHSGNMWFGTNKGLFRVAPDGIAHTVIDSSQGAISFVYSVHEDRYHRIWVATIAGLVCIEDQQLRIYKTSDGLISNKCFCITEDSYNNTLWVGTEKGLNYVDLHTLKVGAYTEGIHNKEVHSIYCDNQHTLYLGTTDNLFSINPHLPVRQAPPPPVYITAVRTAAGRMSRPTAVSVSYNEHKIAIDFTAISFKHPNGVEYRYKVINLDNNWRTTNNNSIELAALPSGEYTFVLNARNSKGVWSKDVTLPITIATPIWKKYWFSILVFSALTCAIYSISRTLTQRTERKKREQLQLLNKVAYLKQQALSALINPHFIFNCMNSIQHFMNRQDNDKANSYLADFAHLIRLTMENAQDAFISLDKEVKRLKLYLSLEQLRFGEDLTYSIAIDEDIDMYAVYIPNMIIQPFVENAIWHGIMPNEGRGNIAIDIKRHAQQELMITITDNGIGIGNSKQQQSADREHHYGISLTQERLQLLKQLSHLNHKVDISQITDNTNGNSGTLVTITLPLIHSDKPFAT